MGQMDGKVCIVTGGAGSIGRACAAALRDAGGKVLLVDRDETNLTAAMTVIGGDNIETFVADVADGPETKAYVEAAVERWGHIDVLFSNAGLSGDIRPIADYPEEVFDELMAVNVRASFLACKYAVPHMRDGGSIVITSSIMGVQANPGIVAYATSKHAVIGMMRSVAKELAPRNIRCNVVAPGPVDNDFQTDIEDRLSNAVGTDATAMINQRIPLGRHANAGEIAPVVLFLASDAASFCTGSVYMVDGGLHA